MRSIGKSGAPVNFPVVAVSCRSNTHENVTYALRGIP